MIQILSRGSKFEHSASDFYDRISAVNLVIVVSA